MNSSRSPSPRPLPLGEGATATILTGPAPYSFRLPKDGEVDPHFGCSRTFWAERIRANGKPAAVRSFKLAHDGAKNGIRLIDYQSARDYLDRINAEQHAETLLSARCGRACLPLDKGLTQTHRAVALTNA